jgi:hypothetical protein
MLLHEMGYRSQFLEESDRERQPNIEMITVELRNNWGGLEKLENLWSGLSQTSFR